MRATWSKHAWREWEVAPLYPRYDGMREAELNAVYREIESHPPLVDMEEIAEFRRELTVVGRGEKFLLHIGDCSEEFAHSSAPVVQEKVAFYLRIAKALEESIGQEILCLARMGGQYAKSRSSPVERRGEVERASYFGDIYNDFCSEMREIVPSRMLEAYFRAKETIAHVNGKFFLSHEGLNLYYESALTRAQGDRWWNLSTHFPWLGWRSFHSKAHAAYLQGIENPIGIKVGPYFDGEHLLSLLHRFNPSNAEGKIVLIYRFGVDRVEQELARLLPLVESHPVLLVADVMHGNTRYAQERKIRFIEEIAEELRIASNSVPLHGVHLEAAPGPILECLSKRNTAAQQIVTTKVDLRLNEQQVLEVLKQLPKAATLGMISPI